MTEMTQKRLSLVEAIRQNVQSKIDVLGNSGMPAVAVLNLVLADLRHLAVTYGGYRCPEPMTFADLPVNALFHEYIDGRYAGNTTYRKVCEWGESHRGPHDEIGHNAETFDGKGVVSFSAEHHCVLITNHTPAMTAFMNYARAVTRELEMRAPVEVMVRLDDYWRDAVIAILANVDDPKSFTAYEGKFHVIDNDGWNVVRKGKILAEFDSKHEALNARDEMMQTEIVRLEAEVHALREALKKAESGGP